MSILFELPRDLYNEVCFGWLKTIDMGKLDSSMCSSLYRDILMIQMRDKSMKYYIRKELASYYNWVIIRKIALQSLVCTRFFFDADGHCNFNIMFHRVQDLYLIEIDRISLQSVRQIISACTNLVYLEWSVLNKLDIFECGSLGTRLCNLKHLYVELRRDRLKTYEWIVKHCDNLQTLSFTSESFNLTDETQSSYKVLLQILRNNSNTLEHLDLKFSFDLINDVTKLCPKVKTIKMDMGEITLQQTLYYINTFGDRVEFRFSHVGYCEKEPKGLRIDIWDEEEAEIVNFMTQFEGLSKLEIANMSDFLGTFEGFQGDNVVNDMFMRSFATLTELKISGKLFTCNAINQILSECKKLQILTIDGVSTFKDVFLHIASSTSIILTEFHLHKLFIPYQALIALFQHLQSLRIVTIKGDLDSQLNSTNFEAYQVANADPNKELLMTTKQFETKTRPSWTNLLTDVQVTYCDLEFTRNI